MRLRCLRLRRARGTYIVPFQAGKRLKALTGPSCFQATVAQEHVGHQIRSIEMSTEYRFEKPQQFSTILFSGRSLIRITRLMSTDISQPAFLQNADCSSLLMRMEAMMIASVS